MRLSLADIAGVAYTDTSIIMYLERLTNSIH